MRRVVALLVESMVIERKCALRMQRMHRRLRKREKGVLSRDAARCSSRTLIPACASSPRYERRLTKFRQNVARFRLYRLRFLQQNMRSTAFFKLYKIAILLHRCNLKIFAKNRFEKTAIFVKFQLCSCKCRKICKNLSNFKKVSLRIWFPQYCEIKRHKKTRHCNSDRTRYRFV